MSQPLDIQEFLIDHDSIVLSLGAESGEIVVNVPGLGRTSIRSLDELVAALTSTSDFDNADSYARREGGPRGYVLKADPEHDLYAVWSSVVDNAVAIGTRADLLAEGVSPSRIARADRYGTSAQWPAPSAENPQPERYLGWKTPEILVHEQKHAPSNGSGLLPRACLGEFIMALGTNDDKLAGSLLVALPDDEEETI